jgi:hypothetical protein
MAFNLVHSFRKHQKAWMAGILMVCMITFVLCTGVGDFGQWVLGWFGHGRGEALARTRASGKITADQLTNLRVQRKIADDFMGIAVATAHRNAMSKIAAGLDQNVMATLQMNRLRLLRSPTDQQNAFSIRRRLREGLPSKLSDRDNRLINEFTDLVIEELNAPLPEKGKQFFDGTETDEDLFEFILWREEAKRLNIGLVDDGVRAQVTEATRDRLNPDDWSGIEEYLRRSEKYSFINSDYLLNALRDEFQVRLAQTVLLGYQPGVRAAPAVTMTPDQFWQYYEKNRSEFTAWSLPIAVEAFVDQVRTPSDQELHKFFEKYKSIARDPEIATPGLKIPEKVEIQWVCADPEAPQIKGLVAFVAAVTRARMGIAWEASLADRYDGEKYKYPLPSWTEQGFVRPFFINAANEKTWNRPDNAAALTAQTIATSATGLTLGAGFAPASGAAVVAGYDSFALADPAAKPKGKPRRAFKEERRLATAEIHKRAAVAATLVLSSTNPWPAVPGVKPTVLPFKGTWTYASATSQYLPLGAVRQRIAQMLEEEVAKELVSGIFRDLDKKLQKLNPAEKPTKYRDDKVMKLVNPAVRNGLTMGETTRVRSREDIAKDPGLKGLKADFEQALQGVRFAKLQELQNQLGARPDLFKVLEEMLQKTYNFADQFFDPAVEVYVPRHPGDREANQSDRTPLRFFLPKQYLFWKTAVYPARVPESLKEVRPEVIKQWKFKEARKLARKRARQLERETSTKLATYKAGDADGRRRYLQDVIARLREEKILKPDQNYILLSQIAPIAQKKGIQVLDDSYTAYQVPADLFDHPQVKPWSEKLLSLAKPNTPVVLLENKPESVYYVTARVEQPTANEGLFVESYQRRDGLWKMAQAELAKEHRQRVVAELKKRAEFEDLRSEEAKKRRAQESQ